MKSYSIVYYSKEDLTKLSQEHSNLEKNDLFIQIFTTTHRIGEIKQLIKLIKDVFPSSKIIGTSAVTSICNGITVENGCVISVTELRNTEVSILSLPKYSSKEDDYNLGLLMANQLYKGHEKVAITLLDGEYINPDYFIKGFQKKKKEILIIGGISTNNQYDESFVFTEEETIQNGVVMAVLANKNLHVYTNYNSGWYSIGKRQIITKAKGRVIKTIENKPAKQWYERYISYKMDDEGHTDLGVKFPLMIKRDNMYIAKPILSFTNEGYLVTKQGIKDGDEIRLGYGDITKIINNIKEISLDIVKYPIETLFAYSCIARKLYLKGLTNLELKPFENKIDISGFFTNGEFAYINGKNIFVSETMVLLGLYEGVTNNYIDVDLECIDKHIESKGKEQVVLNHLIRITSDELDKLNNSLKQKVLEQTKKLKDFYFTDELTNLYNRNRFNVDYNNKAFNKLALLDIEDFTMINNFYGNKVGNIILKQIASFLKAKVKKHKLKVYRIYADKFVIVGDEAFPDHQFLYYIRDLQEFISRKSFSIGDHEIYLNILVSLTVKEEQLLEKASLTLDYLRTNKKTLQVYHPLLKIEHNIEKNLFWVKKIKKAIKEDRIIPYFQPIHNNRTNKVDKYEALIRMIDEDGSIISPFYFLNIAKKTNMYPTLTKIMIEKTFNVFMDKDYQFSINLTVEDILDRETKNYIINKLNDFSHPKRVIFEIVESEGIENFKEVKRFIDQIKEYGAKIAIDDFGSGYSNLSYLVQLKVDILKLDGSIIKKIVEDEVSQYIAETIFHLAKKLEVSTVAEFVENEQIYEKVKALNIDYSQGYYFSKPLPEIL